MAIGEQRLLVLSFKNVRNRLAQFSSQIAILISNARAIVMYYFHLQNFNIRSAAVRIIFCKRKLGELFIKVPPEFLLFVQDLVFKAVVHAPYKHTQPVWNICRRLQFRNPSLLNPSFPESLTGILYIGSIYAVATYLRITS